MDPCKIELRNLPNFTSYVLLKKFVEKTTKKTPHRIKIIKKHPVYAYLSFDSDQDRNAAIDLLDGIKWKNKKLKAKKASVLQDPYLAKHQTDADDDASPAKKAKLSEIHLEQLTSEQLGDLINDQICPLWKTPYDEQLKLKENKYRDFIADLTCDIESLYFDWDKDEPTCTVKTIKPSPVINGYRNKCEFSIGTNKVVGFRLGMYKEGSISVIRPPDNCPIVSEKMHKIVSLFESFLLKNKLPGFNQVTKQGYWRQLTVRCTFSPLNGSMIIIALHPQDMTPEQLDELKTEIKEHLLAHKDECSVTSVFFDVFKTKDKTAHDQSALELIQGNDYIEEVLQNGTLFLKISPLAFFQTNTLAAEVCYDTIASLVDLTSETVVLDLCCGTGAIGLYLAKKVRRVVGIELNYDAIKDARHNANGNGIFNFAVHHGKAESMIEVVIAEIFRDCGKDCDLVAIIDPPRAGLNSSVIKCLRATAAIKKLIYVSCEPNIAKTNLIDLSRPKSNAFKGDPFFPTLAQPIDMFPHTSHCELVLLYERRARLTGASRTDQ